MVKISDQPKSLSTGKRVSSSSSSAAVSIKTGDYDGLLSLAEKSAIDDIERLLKVAQQTLSSRRDCGCGLLDITNRIACPREALTRSATGGSCCCCCSDCSRQNERTEWHLSEEEETTPPAPHLSNALITNSAKQQQQQPDAVVDCHALAAVGRQKSDARNDEEDSPSFAAKTSADPSRTDPVDAPPPPPPRANGGGGGGGGESPSLHCGGYSKQRRHGRKASLGTTEIKRLIPTLVSENEEFRYKEYRRKSSASAPDDAQNLTL